MNTFQTLFGVTPQSLRETCVIAPFVTRTILGNFKIKKLSRGALYSVGDNGRCSLICTGIGASFLGDAVLYLEGTACENLVLFGSCGAAASKKAFGVGSIGVVKKALSQDSFVDILLQRKARDTFYPDRRLLKACAFFKDTCHLTMVNCLSVGSLKLEAAYLGAQKRGSIDIVDMETSAFYAAAERAKKKAIAILFVTDIIKKMPYYAALKKKERSLFHALSGMASKAVYEIVQKIT